ncbi:MAG: methylmalonyl-CoA epimerase [Bacteroidetes bacterium]|nr:methylmalonyl-CoA epimerase [Bacteroidota bacterium]
MAITKIDHIGIAVKEIDAVLKLYRDLLGLKVTAASQGKSQNMVFMPVGESQLEIMEPVDPEAAVGKYIERRGEGIHHICFQVDDIEATLKTLAEAGVELIDQVPRVNAHGKKVAFVHPRSCHGVLVEFYE